MSVGEEAPPSAAVRARPLVVSAVRQETVDAVTVTFEVPDDIANDFKYFPGQFVTVKVPSDQTGHVSRCYSLCSSPHIDDYSLEIGVKRTDGGYASNWICDNIEPGMEVMMLPPSGNFTPKSLDADLLLFAGGSGITPILSIIKSALIAGGGEVALFYANRDKVSAMYRDQLCLIADGFPERFALVEWFENDCGLPNSEVLDDMISRHAGSEIFTCGPAPFMDLVETCASNSDVSRQAIHREVFQSLAGDPFDGATVRRLAADEGTAMATVYLDGECIKVSWPRSAPLLDVLLSKGYNAPYSCREGACSACVCKLIEGDVDMVENHVLIEDDVTDGERLACQAIPLTDSVIVSFDDL
ncbi:ferredoxin--NADP reductase [Jongsikchunia kroppenstedtii]|uniref:ferredoxin--NADP reductase n=1 Tax=Jongsikchunia kroppenstedtii TaxID=1121721 RepID=UPI0009DA0352|nr:ferredoxin--NADP reductase [Jongsikchunia kroppenstedtii]